MFHTGTVQDSPGYFRVGNDASVLADYLCNKLVCVEKNIVTLALAGYLHFQHAAGHGDVAHVFGEFGNSHFRGGHLVALHDTALGLYDVRPVLGVAVDGDNTRAGVNRDAVIEYKAVSARTERPCDLLCKGYFVLVFRHGGDDFPGSVGGHGKRTFAGAGSNGTVDVAHAQRDNA